MKRLLAFLAVLVLLPACATTVSGRYQAIDVASDTDGSTARIDCRNFSVPATPLPARLSLKRKADACRVVVSAPGAADRTVELKRGTNPRIWWNFAIGGSVGTAAAYASALDDLLCDNPDGCGSNSESAAFVHTLVWTGVPMLIDYWTGAMFRHEPERVEVTMK